MSKEILNLQPQAVWKHFYALTQIPRPSKHEQAAVDYVVNFGKELGLETIVDEVKNVVIRKPATPGMENRKGVILQGHLDMVPQKNSDKVHDFEKDPIDAYIDGEWVTANGTTLGADNGIGVAATLAVLEDKNLAHGPIEALFTIDEETGMTGAFALKPELLKGDILMNLDSEDEGELYVGCAGGLDANIELDYSEELVPEGYTFIKIAVTGLKGGHSGMDIITGRANSIKLLIRFLLQAEKKFGIRISSLDGGSLRNAIPREAFATVGVPTAKIIDFENLLKAYLNIYKAEFSLVEPDLSMKIQKADIPSSVFDSKSQWNLLRAVLACPNGVVRMSDSMPGLVETSTNLARVYSKDGKIYLQCLLRSSVDSAKDALSQKIASVFELAGAKIEFDGAYPGWKPNMQSPILNTMRNVYNNKFGKIPDIKAIHAGLECGLIGGVFPNLDMISFGPTIRYPHSPDEKVKIDTIQMFWDFLVEVLKNVPVK
ncbi:MAG TPA: aminoacyl-histidine dipeptidase [Tenuifilaceae bacterium]|nr:aminoacyl-histidine dipeptidase [Tenuifilaceae bacterium]HPE18840.1 aminoacyl-histidine dipeptidase [Tenuifilaceae bacterium]HPJ46876.1 aminoacyl-histidine dipeptidase [Tenuifilaceae bacterium]HPQ35139.1 aminoacyl-histidine dipeptidase [Tenuifilaceae bacterium]HRX68872.1 aminoacyl-histidine dipeptidase [Tenuifilaceae bacterium]